MPFKDMTKPPINPSLYAQGRVESSVVTLGTVIASQCSADLIAGQAESVLENRKPEVLVKDKTYMRLCTGY